MFKILPTVLMTFFVTGVFASVDINKADFNQLDAIKGLGPVTSSNVMEARKEGPFKDWPDFIERVKGIGAGKAVLLSKEGLTINGISYKASRRSSSVLDKKRPKPTNKTDQYSTTD